MLYRFFFSLLCLIPSFSVLAAESKGLDINIDKTVAELSAGSEGFYAFFERLYTLAKYVIALPAPYIERFHNPDIWVFQYVVAVYLTLFAVIHLPFLSKSVKPTIQSLMQSLAVILAVCILTSIMYEVADSIVRPLYLRQSLHIFMSLCLLTVFFRFGVCLRIKVPYVYAIKNFKDVIQKSAPNPAYARFFLRVEKILFYALLIPILVQLVLVFALVRDQSQQYHWSLTAAGFLELISYLYAIFFSIYIILFQKKNIIRTALFILLGAQICLAATDLFYTIFRNDPENYWWASFDIFFLLSGFLMLSFFKIIGERFSDYLLKAYPILKVSNKVINLPKIFKWILFALISLVIIQMLIRTSALTLSYQGLSSSIDLILKRSVSIIFDIMLVLALHAYTSDAIKKVLATHKHYETTSLSTAKFIALFSAIGWFIPAFIWAIALYTMLVQLGISTPYIAGTFGVGIAFIGFAFQQQLSNTLAGFSFVMRGIILFGRDVTLSTKGNPFAGRVEEIYLQFVGVRGTHGNIHFVQYSQITGATIHDDAYAEILVNVQENTDLYHVMDLMQDELKHLKVEQPGFEAEEFEFLEPQLLDKGCVQIQARVKTKALEQWKMRHDFFIRMRKRLKTEKIQICAAAVQAVPDKPDASW